MQWRPLCQAPACIRDEGDRWDPKLGGLRYTLRWVYDYDARKGHLVVFAVTPGAATDPKVWFELPEPEQ